MENRAEAVCAAGGQCVICRYKREGKELKSKKHMHKRDTDPQVRLSS